MNEAQREGPFGCAQCWPLAAETALEVSKSLTPGQDVIDDSHLGVMIRTCPSCGQHFVAVFLEHIDWQDGDDSQYWTLMPITEAESVDLLAMNKVAAIARLNGLPSQRRCLQKDHPKGGPDTVSWGSGLWIVN